MITARKLVMLDAADTLDFLRSPPGNRLEALKGERKGHYSIRTNDLYRVCFRCTDLRPTEVEIVDYHRDERNVQESYAVVHPGEIMREEFVIPMGLRVNALAKTLHVPTPTINEVVRGRCGVSADTAMRLARYFAGDAWSWLNLHAAYDFRISQFAVGVRIGREIKLQPDFFHRYQESPLFRSALKHRPA